MNQIKRPTSLLEKKYIESALKKKQKCIKQQLIKRGDPQATKHRKLQSKQTQSHKLLVKGSFQQSKK